MVVNFSALEHALRLLQFSPCPDVPNPPSCRKRASIALILRVRPFAPPHLSTVTTTSDAENDEQSLENFFAQEWVQDGDPEILFIRRAARQGDRWTGHIAFPGGKRDPNDASDCAAAERETLEEVGLDLATTASGGVCYVGGLPQQIVSTNWGNVPFVSCVSSYYDTDSG